MEHISHSQLTTFIECELRWKLSRDPAVLAARSNNDGTWDMKAGSFIHTVMELFHHPDYLPRNTDDILGVFFDHADEEIPLRSPYEGQVRASLRNFIDSFGLDEGHAPTYVEMDFTVPFPGLKGYNLAGIFDDITFDNVNREIVLGEYKSSLKEIDPEVKVWQTWQGYVYQYACSVLYPDYRVTGIQYTLIDPKKAIRVMRPLYPDSVPEWKAYMTRLGKEMKDVKTGKREAFPNYQWKCGGRYPCPFWRETCQRKLMMGF